MLARMWKNWIPLTLLVGTKKVQLLWEIVWQFLKILNMELPHDLAIPLLGIYPKEIKTYVHTKTCIQMSIAALFIIAKKGKQHKCVPADGWINKMWYIHTKECYLAIKRHEVQIHATTWTNLKNIVPSQRSQSQKTTYYMITFI